MDIWDKEKRSAVMAKIKSKDTKPELLVRRYLYHRGYRYRKNVKGLPGTPDIVMKKYGIAIFVHGCFWHGHDADMHLPATNSDYWAKKISQNKAHDAANKEALKRMGWKVMTIWECQLKPAVREKTLLEVEYWINHSYLQQLRRLPDKSVEPPEPEKADGNVAAEPETKYGD